jgi:hypothetical protein
MTDTLLRKFAICFLLCSFAAKALCVEWLPEIKGGYFFPTDHRFRKIYSGGGIYALEINAQAWGRWYAWANASYFSESGYSNQKSRTIITLIPTQIGLKYLFNFFDPYRFYLGFGATPTYLNTRDYSQYVIRSVHKWGIGGVAKAGLLINTGQFFLDLFADYSFTKIPFHNTHHGHLVRHDADISGWTLGAGVGYRFGSPKRILKRQT